jgi:adenylate cyclase
MSADLAITVKGQESKIVSLGPLFSMGREPSNDLMVNDVKASRNHAVIRLQGDNLYYILDLGSSNGTLLNGRLVSIPRALKSGDEIQIANYRMVFTDKNASSEASEIPEGLRTQVEMSHETISILVVDIRNYTPLSENLPAQYMAKIIGEWFKEVQMIIESHGGEIDKFIGDAVMAYWLKARTKGNNQYVVGPIQTAIEIVKLAEIFNQRLSAIYPEFGFRIGCGINAGLAMFGNVGVDSRRDVTVVGDCVNVAFRIETLCKQLERCIVLTDEVKNAADGQFEFEDLGLHKLKGKWEEQRIFSVVQEG